MNEFTIIIIVNPSCRSVNMYTIHGSGVQPVHY